jgi:hypothetical protein
MQTRHDRMVAPELNRRQGTVFDGPRRVIHVVRVVDEILDFAEIDDIAERMRNYALSRHGEQAANVVVVQGSGKENCASLAIPTQKRWCVRHCLTRQ